MNKKNKSGFIGAGLLTAIAASLCCITPLLALFTGVSGLASTFSWMEPYRPILIVVTLAVLAFAWYQKLKPAPVQIDCECDDEKKPSLLQSKKFLGVITIFSIAMLAFPYYGHIFYPSGAVKRSKSEKEIYSINYEEVAFTVKGMTCQACEEHIKYSVNELPGIKTVKANAKTGIVNIEYDSSSVSKNQLVKAINKTPYKVRSE